MAESPAESAVFHSLWVDWRRSRLHVIAHATRMYATRGRPLPDAWRQSAMYWICNQAEHRYKPGCFPVGC